MPAFERVNTQYELGLGRAFMNRKMSFEVGLFDVTRDNVAILNPANPSGFYSVVTGQQHSHGTEVNLGGKILPKLKINAVATFLRALVSNQMSDRVLCPCVAYAFMTDVVHVLANASTGIVLAYETPPIGGDGAVVSAPEPTPKHPRRQTPCRA